MTTMQCPHCNGAMNCDSKLLGTEVSCPHCGNSLVLPSRPIRPEAPQQVTNDTPSIEQTTPSILHRRQRKRNDPNQIVRYALGGFAIFVVLLLIIGSLAEDGGDDEREKKRKPRSSKQMNRKFAATPDSYKGKTVTLTKMRFASNAGLHTWKHVAIEKGFVNGDRYMTPFEGNPDLEVGIFIPFDMNVPNVSQSDEVTIKFRCKEGSSSWGNELVSLKRK